jgi:hypothetical protein
MAIESREDPVIRLRISLGDFALALPDLPVVYFPAYPRTRQVEGPQRHSQPP